MTLKVSSTAVPTYVLLIFNSILSVEESALEWVAKRGYDDLMGGRGLKRQIEKDITALSAVELAKMDQLNAILLRVFLENEKLLLLKS